MQLRWQTLALVAVLAAAAFALVWVVGASSRGAKPSVDPDDHRPVARVLYIGNSHTFVNDVPAMVTQIADSLHAPRRYVPERRLVGGQSLKGHWNDGSVRAALNERWAAVIVQPRGLEATFADNRVENDEFLDFGGRLLDAARAVSPRVALYEVWRPKARAYGKDWWFVSPQGGVAPLEESARPQALETIFETKQRLYATLAGAHGADVVNVCAAWRTSEARCPSIELYAEDDHHASPRGSYLAALVIARWLEGGVALPSETYTPSWLGPADAACLRAVANGS